MDYLKRGRGETIIFLCMYVNGLSMSSRKESALDRPCVVRGLTVLSLDSK